MYFKKFVSAQKNSIMIYVNKLFECINIIIFLIIIKLLFFGFGYFFYIVQTNSTSGMSPFLSIFNRWDVRHYITIAERGYTVLENGTLIHVVMPPFWPIFIYLVNIAIHNTVLSGLLLANFFSLIGGIVLYLLLKKDYEEKIAFYSTVLLFVFPTAFYLYLPYTEALFFFLVVTYFFALRSRKLFVASLFCFFACTTRVVGFLLIVTYFIEYYSLYGFSFNRRFLNCFLIIGGFAVYLLFNYYYTGDLFAFLDVQKQHWTHKKANLLNIPFQIFNNVKSLLFSSNLTTNGMIVDRVEPFFSLFSVIILLIGRKVLRSSYFWYGVINYLLLFSQSFWLSNTRYILMIFPLFIVLSLYFFKDFKKNYRVVLGFCYVFFCIMLLSFFYMRFVIGHMTAL